MFKKLFIVSAIFFSDIIIFRLFSIEDISWHDTV